MIDIKKILTIFLILMLVIPSVYAADTKKADGISNVSIYDHALNASERKQIAEGKVTEKDNKPITDDTKEKETKIINKDKSITGDIKVTTKDVSKFSVKKKSDYEISISKSGEHTKAKVSISKSELQKIDIDKDGKFGILHISDTGEVTHTTATEAELVAGKEMTFSENIVNGYSGYKQYTFSDVESGDTLNIEDVSGNYTVAVAVSGAVPEYVAGIPRTGLLGEWKLNGNYLDTSGNDHHGTKIGNVQFATSYDNSQCIFINETGGYINVGNIALGNKNATLIADVKPFKTTSEKNRGIFSRYYFQNSLALSTTGVSRHAMNNVMVSGTIPYTNTSWTQTALTYNGELASNQLKIYENAVHVGSGTLTANIINEDRAWTIGAYGAFDPAYYFHGWIDNVRVYTQALSSEELAQIYAGGSGISFRPKPSYNWTGYNVSSGVAKTLDIDSTVTGIEVVNTAGTTLDTVTVVMQQNNSADNITTEEFFSDDWWNVSISFTPAVDYTNHRMIFKIPGNYKGQATLSGNNTNASISRNQTHFTISTGYLAAGSTYYYNVEIPVVRASFVNPSATVVVVITAAGAFVGGSFINQWYRRRRNNN